MMTKTHARFAGRVVLCTGLAVLALLPGVASASYPSRVVADGPVAYWRLGETPGATVAADQTSNANSGTYTGGAALGQPGALPGDPNTAVQFDGVNDAVDVSDSNSLDATTGVTVEAWVKRTRKALQVIVGKPGNSTLKVQNYALWFTNGNNVRAHFGSGSAVATVSGSSVINTEWHHLVATYDNVTARVYVDGVLDGTKASTVKMAANTQPLSIGRETGTAATYFGGTLDEVAVYGKVLTAAQIKSHFDATDVTAPVVTLAAPANGGVTNSATPAFSGTAGTGATDSSTVTVKLYSGPSATGFPAQTLTATRSGAAWSVSSLVPLIDGTYTAQAEQTDVAGNTGASPANTFTVDRTAPAVTLTDPANGSAGGDATPAFAGAAGAQSDDGQTITVRIYSGTAATGTPVRTLTAPRSGGGWTATPGTDLTDGTYTAQATQTDTAGNTGTSAANTFSIDATAPAVTLTSPAGGSTTNDATPTLAGGAGAQAGDGQAVTVRVYAGTTATGAPVQTLSTNRAGGSWTATPSQDLTDGAYTAQAEQSDAVGNTGTSAARTFTVDTAAPAVTLTTPADGSTTDDATPTLAGAAGTGSGDGQTITVRIYAGATATGAPVSVLTTGRNGDAWTAAPSSDLAGGLYTARAEQSDAAGNTGTSAAHTFSVDTAAPAVTLTAPADGSSTNDATPALAGAAGTGPGDGQTITVRIYAGATATGAPVSVLATDRTGGTWSTTPSTDLADGLYTAQAAQSDDTGNTGTSAAHTFTVDTAAPAVTLTTPADGSTTNDATATLAGAAGADSGDGQTITVRIYAGTTATGTPVRTLTAARAGGSWTATPSSNLADGTYTARAEQSDAAGNSATSAAHTFTIDTFVPDTFPPVVTITSPADGATTNDATPTLAGTAGTDAGDGQTVTARIYAGTSATGSPVQTLSVTRDGEGWTATPNSSLPDGTYTAQASQGDAAGNTGTSAARTFTIDSAAPAVTLTAPADGSTTGDTTPTLAGAAGTDTGDLQTITVRVYAGTTTAGFLLRTMTVTADSGSWSTSNLAPLPEGTYTAQASQSDAAGNTGAGAAHTFTIDATAPDVTVTTPADGSTTGDPTPTLAGAAGTDTGDGQTITVRIFAGTTATGAPVQTLTTNRAGGAWTATPSSDLADGAYTAQATQDDTAGNTGTSAAHTFTVDTAAPAVTLTAPADGATINDPTPALAGAAGTQAGDGQTITVRVYAGTTATGTPVRTLTADRTGGSWTATLSASLADGTYTAQAEQSDAVGNTGTSAAHTFAVDTTAPDTTAPAVTITDPADGSTASDPTPGFAGVAGTDAGDGQTVTTRIYAGTTATGAPVRTLTAHRTGGSWAATPSSSLADGTYTAQASQSDNAGNTGTSAAHTFTVDTAAPAVTLTTPADGSTTNDATPTLAGAAGTQAGDGQTITVRVYAGATAVQTLTTDRDGGAWTATPGSDLADGTYTARAEQTDAAGNTATSAAHTFTVDTASPAVTLTTPADGATINDATPTLAGAAGTLTGDGQAITVRIYAGTTATGSPVRTLTTNRTGGAWTATPSSALADGTFTAEASQTDTAGNTGTSAAHTFTIDTAAPAVTLTTPADGSTTNDATPTLAGAAGSDAGDGQTITVRVYTGTTATGTPVQTLTTDRAGGAWTTTPSSTLADGTYTARATQTDAAGNTGTSTAHTFTIDTVVPDTFPPVVTITSPADDTTTNDATPTLAGTAGTDAGDSQTVTARIYAGTSATGTPVRTLSATRDGDAWTATPASSLPAGTYTAQATQTDTAGNTGTSAAHTFTIDTAAPAVTLTAPADNASTNDTTPTLAGTAGTQAGDGQTITVRIYAGSTTAGFLLRTVTVTADNGNWSTSNLAPLADGTHTAQASQTDAAGNTGTSAAHTFTVDTAAPAVTLTTPADGATTNDTTPTFSGAAGAQAGDGQTITVRVYAGTTATGTPVQTLTTDRTGGAWTATPGTELPTGTYTARSEQTDTADNPGTSAAHTFTIEAAGDTTAPAVTLTDPADGASTNDATPTLAGAAGTDAGDSQTVTARIYAGTSATGVPVQTLTATRDGAAWTATPGSNLADGIYTARAQQSDAASNVGLSAPHTFTVDTAAPAVTLTSPVEGSASSNRLPTFSGAAGTAAGDAATVTARVYAGAVATGSPIQTLTATRAGGTWSVAAGSQLADGTYTVRASQDDAAGNTGSSVAVRFKIGPTYRDQVIADGARGYWRYGESSGTVAADLGTSNTPGAYQNGVTLGVPGAIGNDANTAARFDGTNDIVNYGDPANGAMDAGTADFSVEFWIKTTINNSQSVLGKQGTSGPYWQILVTNAAGQVGKLRVSFNDGTTLRQTYSSVRVDDGAWHHVAVSFKRTVGIDVYTDGDRSTKAGALTATLDNTAAFQVGKVTGFPQFKGDLDEVAIYNKALTAQDVGNHLVSTQGPDVVGPVPTLTDPPSSGVTDDPKPSFAGKASLAPGDQPAMTVKLWAGSSATGAPLQTLTTTAGSSGAWATNATASLPDGLYTVRAEQSDNNGNVGASTPTTFTVSRSSATATYRQAVLDDDPAAYWRLRETAGIAVADRTSNENTGTALNGAGLGAAGAVIGDPSAGTAFDGSDDEINMGDPASGALDLGTGDFSIEMWVRTTSNATQGLLAKQPASGGPLYQLLVTSAPGFVGHVRVTINDGTTQRQGYSAEPIDDGQWHYVAVSVDRDLGMTIYVDDDGAYRNGAAVRSLDNAAPLQVGRVTGFPSLNGSIDEVAIYRRALSATEALHHYTEGTRLEGTTPAPTLTSPTPSQHTTDATPTYSGRAGIVRGDRNPIVINVYDGPSAGGTPRQSVPLNVEPSGEYSLESGQPLPQGTYTAQAEQRDTAGGIGRSAPVTFTVDPATPPNPADPTLLTAGDIAGCSSSGDEATANLLDALPGTIQTLGDNAYESGTAAEFTNCYQPSWGRHKARTHPAVGDHEYLTPNATPYFNYFGAAAGDPTKGYYSYDLGAWHIVVMNTVCDKVTGGCDAGSPQEQWVRADLAAHPTRCAIGVMTEPRYSSGSIHGPGGGVQSLWQALYDNGADIVVTGDDHVYERFAPMTPDGRLDRVRGIRQFTVGTGGHSHTAFGPRQLNSETGDDATFGILRLGLHPTSYDWDFVPIVGSTFTDSGSRSCSS